jgi:hypothetical protein
MALPCLHVALILLSYFYAILLTMLNKDKFVRHIYRFLAYALITCILPAKA